MKSDFKNIPIIDLSPWQTATSSAEIDRQIEYALDQYGFMNLVGHGICESLVRSIESELVKYFSRPCEQKSQNKVQPANYRGYIPLGFFSPNNGNGANDYYEGYKLHYEVNKKDRVCSQCSLYGPNKWPENTIALRSSIMSYWVQCDMLSMMFLGAFERILGLKDNSLRKLFDIPLTNMTLLHYPALEQGSGIHPHKDTDVLTFLPPGLGGEIEIKISKESEWISVECPQNSLLANVGDMLEIWSGGRFASTSHRVKLSPNRSRYSFPYFLVPRHDAVIKPLLPPRTGYSRTAITAGDLSRKIWTSNWPDSAPLKGEFDPYKGDILGGQ